MRVKSGLVKIWMLSALLTLVLAVCAAPAAPSTPETLPATTDCASSGTMSASTGTSDYL